MKNIILTGGSGLIGTSLSTFLSKEGNKVNWLSRKNSKQDYPTYLWNPPTSDIDIAALTGKEVLIQLAGSNIAGGLWTKKRKKEIIDSRLKAIQTLYLHLKKHRLHISHIIQASAIGYYGNRGSEVINEQSSAGKEGFLTEVCKIWETEASCLKEFCDHFTIMRTAFYISPDGGIWPNLIRTKRFGFLLYFGDGSQYYSWIHYLDFNRAILFIINQQLDGIINLTAPNPISNKDFISEINNQLKRNVLQFGVSASILKLLLGEFSQSVLSSAYVLPGVLMENGFQFQFVKLDVAVKDLLDIK